MEWFEKFLSVYEKPYSEVPQEVIDGTRDRLKSLQSDKPLVSIVIVAYNEEKRLPACLWSLSEQQCKYPVEFIGVDNESKDRTAEIYQAFGVPYYTEHQHTCGYARQCGLNQAKGKYAMCIDCDTMYPPHYIELMVDNLMQPGVSAVAAMWSYYPDENHSKLQMKMYEFFRDIYLRIQNINRPELTVRGLAFGYYTENAMKEGYRVELLRGEDGSMALSMKKYGKIKFVYDKRCRVITGYGGLKEKSIFAAMWHRLKFYGVTRLFSKTDHYDDAPDNFLKAK
jgi:glycosyltransferase involved in cell wall biosynthesis